MTLDAPLREELLALAAAEQELRRPGARDAGLEPFAESEALVRRRP